MTPASYTLNSMLICYPFFPNPKLYMHLHTHTSPLVNCLRWDRWDIDDSWFASWKPGSSFWWWEGMRRADPLGHGRAGIWAVRRCPRFAWKLSVDEREGWGTKDWATVFLSPIGTSSWVVGSPWSPAILGGRDHLCLLLCVRLDFLSGWARVYTQCFPKNHHDH